MCIALSGLGLSGSTDTDYNNESGPSKRKSSFVNHSQLSNVKSRLSKGVSDPTASTPTNNGATSELDPKQESPI